MIRRHDSDGVRPTCHETTDTDRDSGQGCAFVVSVGSCVNYSHRTSRHELKVFRKVPILRCDNA
eukprot:1681592-Prymnesium_polylepis.1